MSKIQGKLHAKPQNRAKKHFLEKEGKTRQIQGKLHQIFKVEEIHQKIVRKGPVPLKISG